MIDEDTVIKGITTTSTYSHFYIITPIENQAQCKMCRLKFDYNQQKSGTNSLKRHLERKHPRVAIARQNAKSTASSSSQPTLFSFSCASSVSKKTKLEIPPTEKCVLGLACAKHVLPLHFFEDNVVTVAFNLPNITRHTVHNQIRLIAEQLRETTLEKNRGQWASLVLDGWRNSVTSRNHLTIMMFVTQHPTTPIFLRSFVTTMCDSNFIANCINDIVSHLTKYDITVISVITDNAKCMIKACNTIFDSHPNVLPLRCSAHIFNLIVKDIFHNVEFIKKSLEILHDYIENKLIRRYCQIRWNSAFDRLQDLLTMLGKSSDSEKQQKVSCVEGAVSALQPFIAGLNIAQTDGTSWEEVYHSFENAVRQTREKGYDKVAEVAEARRHMLLNEIVMLNLFVTRELTLNETQEARLIRWLRALHVNEISQYIADREFIGDNAEIPRRLRLFIEHRMRCIPVSEAAVERCFSSHKMVHSSLRAALTDDIVDDLLYIRYNHKWKYGDLFYEVSDVEDLHMAEELVQLSDDEL